MGPAMVGSADLVTFTVRQCSFDGDGIPLTAFVQQGGRGGLREGEGDHTPGDGRSEGGREGGDSVRGLCPRAGQAEGGDPREGVEIEEGEKGERDQPENKKALFILHAIEFPRLVSCHGNKRVAEVFILKRYPSTPESTSSGWRRCRCGRGGWGWRCGRGSGGWLRRCGGVG